MHSWIQNHVLLELTNNKTRRYSELKPQDVEGNLFMYHLKGLMKEGLVTKDAQAYTLSERGLQFIGTFSLATGKSRQQPKILTAVVCQNEAGKYLFVKWRRQPNIGQVSIPHGMMHYGKTAREMAATELAEKAALEADLTHCGVVYVKGMRDSAVDRHMLVHVFSATNIRPGREDQLRPEVCEAFWMKLEDVPTQDFVPGFYEVLQIAIENDGKPFFEEIEVTVPSS